MSFWTIYEHPKDYPEHFVVRRWEVDIQLRPVDLIITATTLQEARRALPRGLLRVPRSPEDDPVIVETWI